MSSDSSEDEVEPNENTKEQTKWRQAIGKPEGVMKRTIQHGRDKLIRLQWKILLKMIEQQFGNKWRLYLENIEELEDDFQLMLVFNSCCSVLSVSTLNIEVIWGKYSAEEVI
ncbi:hypothetical protein DAPPUDRAFT_113153 [Daphnia pulex]|uniref:Uncharacterized protein n=1 Tax=Daphnia pulex TaxID=6669 RepID=E9HE89_DAPPU|nr:hypothetical protein DAPPUDRAFT_113153 [Daphnia pulex]|eukprot:EFX69977.1 hypothetical protein DAPPUDRAFT_113153 [Daphnia pulex]